MRKTPVLATLLTAAILPAALAAAPLDPSDFGALVEGHTLRFSVDGVPFGAEQYFSGRRSLWQFANGLCTEGVWWPEGDLVCFNYGPEAPRQCWRFERGPSGIAASPVEGGPGSPASELVLDLAAMDETPLACPGPEVGS